jgi:hypothetical protein
MRAMTSAVAALVVAFAMACDRDRQDTTSRLDNAAEETGADVREGTENAGDAVSEGAEDVGDAAREGASDAGGAAREGVQVVKDVANDANESYAQRDEYKREVRERLDRMDQELAELERDAPAGRADAVAAARDAREAVGRSFERLGTATESNWVELRRDVSESLSAAEQQVKALRSDAKPMGGTGGPS